jgi:hypothetical protein
MVTAELCPGLSERGLVWGSEDGEKARGMGFLEERLKRVHFTSALGGWGELIWQKWPSLGREAEELLKEGTGKTRKGQ